MKDISGEVWNLTTFDFVKNMNIRNYQGSLNLMLATYRLQKLKCQSKENRALLDQFLRWH